MVGYMHKKMSSKKQGYVLLLIALAMVVSAYSVSAEMQLLVYIDAGPGFAGVSGFSVVEFNDYAYSYLVEGDYQEVEGLEVRLSDSSGNVLETAQVHQGDNLLDYVAGVSRIALTRSGSEVFSSSIGFCNNNKVCEPCLDGFCVLSENSVSCADCSASSRDGFCDTAQDSICDPDCGFSVADPDCESVCSQDCGIDDPDSLPSCADYRGVACEPDEDCIGGSMIYAVDSMYCCVRGVCADPAEYMTLRMTALNHPESAITPLGERASDVLARIGDYCLDDLKGAICEPHEECAGKWVEFYYDTYCCVGTCKPIPEAFYSDDYVAEIYSETSVPVPEEDVKVLYDMRYDPQEEDDALYGYYDMPAVGSDAFEKRELANIEAIDEIEKEERFSGVKDVVRSIPSAIPEKIKGFNFTILIGTLLVILLIVFVLLAVFRRSAGKVMEQSEKKAASAAARPAVDLQQEIDSLVSRGYDYNQVRSFLLGKGYAKDVVNAEILKNYEARKAAQQRKS